MKRRRELKAGHNRKEEFRILHRREQVAKLMLSGEPQYKIAATLGVHKSQICRDVKAIEKEMEKSANVDYRKFMADQLAKAKDVERMAREAFERSCRDKETTSQKKVDKDGGTRLEATVRKVSQSGNHALLNTMLACISKESDIFERIEARALSEAELDARIQDQLRRLEEDWKATGVKEHLAKTRETAATENVIQT